MGRRRESWFVTRRSGDGVNAKYRQVYLHLLVSLTLIVLYMESIRAGDGINELRERDGRKTLPFHSIMRVTDKAAADICYIDHTQPWRDISAGKVEGGVIGGVEQGRFVVPQQRPSNTEGL